MKAMGIEAASIHIQLHGVRAASVQCKGAWAGQVWKLLEDPALPVVLGA